MRPIFLAALVFFGNLYVASSQAPGGEDGDRVCRAPKPSVGSAREYKVGANSFHVPVLDYLTEFVGQEFDPPISFKRTISNRYLNTLTVEESRALGNDMMVANPYAASCYESEGQAVSLATQVVVNYDGASGQFFNLTQYGATLYVLNSRTDIQTLEDVKGKRIGSNKITSLATHLCYDVLLRSNVHHLQDPEQTIFFRNSNEALGALLEGKIDVGCAASSSLEKYIDPATGQLLDMSRIRVLHPQSHMTDGIPFPFAISSDLVPGYPFVAFPHVEQSVQTRVQKELIAMRDHADVAPSLLACLENAGCNVNNTECVDTCFQSLPPGTIRHCDTTPQRALKAFDALTAGELVGFTKPLQNLRLRDIQETTGFLLKDPSPRCVRMKNIADAVTCPPGHFARSSQEIAEQCSVSGLPCYEKDCICSPCVKAFEVDFFPLVGKEDKDHKEGVGSGCSKFSICGEVEQEHVLSFEAIDNKGRRGAVMTGAFFSEDETEEPFTFENMDGVYRWTFFATGMSVGQKIIKIRINGEEIPESPFRVNVLERDCVEATGDERKEADELGQCVCESGTVELFDKCTPTVILIACILGLLLLCFLILFCCRLGGNRKKDDSVWMVKKEEISFATPPQVLGRGTFGLVLLGEFRGTQVAVKRVIPPRGMTITDNGYKFDVDDEGAVLPGGGEPGPIRDGVAEMAARMSAAGLAHRPGGNAALFSHFIKLKEHFVVEMRVLSRLRHPNVTTLMGAVLDDTEGPLLIMEYMDNGSLYDILHDNSMALDHEILNSILQDISQGLRFLHASDPPIIHGDLKARNILVDSKFRAKVADFGLSHTHKDTDRAVGTPLWQAPELLRGESTNTTASDVYSFGIIIYEVYSRKEPYEHDDRMTVLQDVADPNVNKRPPIPSTCSSQIRSLMKDCLVGDPEQRPTFEEVDHRLKRVEIVNTSRTSILSDTRKAADGDSTDPSGDSAAHARADEQRAAAQQRQAEADEQRAAQQPQTEELEAESK